jgi:hypothetical protein
VIQVDEVGEVLASDVAPKLSYNGTAGGESQWVERDDGTVFKPMAGASVTRRW